MWHIMTPSQKAACALRRAERALRNWQDDPDSPRQDVDKMLAVIGDLRNWVQGHVLYDIERAHERRGATGQPPPASSPE